MKTSSTSDKYQLVAEINMIPFIDIALVLLIIVMVMTPFLVKEQIKINLPSTKSTHAPVDSNHLVQIDVTKDGDIRVDGTTFPDDGVEDAIRKRLTDPENQPVVIAADKDVPFEKVVVAMDAAKRCGAKRMGVSVKHEGGASPLPEASEKTAKSKSAGASTAVKHDSDSRRAAASSKAGAAAGTGGASKSRAAAGSPDKSKSRSTAERTRAAKH